MRSIAVFTLAACLGLLAGQFYATAAPSPKTPPRVQLVGFTTDEFAGKDLGGIFGSYLKCQAEFPDSRVCSRREIQATVAIPDLIAGQTAWWAEVGGAECGEWRNVNTQGNIVRSDGTTDGTGARDCTELHHIACCALVP